MIFRFKTRLILGCCLLLVLFSSCRPKGVLSRKEMADVLYDIHLTEAAVDESTNPISETWTRGLDATYFKDMAYRSALRKHHVSVEDFYYSVSWYTHHMNLYEKVYMDVQLKLDHFKAAIDQGQFDHAGTLKSLGMDSARVRTLYTFGLFRRDTMPDHHLYLTTDTLSSNCKWVANQWLYRMSKETVGFSIYSKSSIHDLFNTSNPDTLRTKADSLLKQTPVPQTPVITQEVVVQGASRLPTRNIRMVSKDDQIRNRFQQRAIDQNQLNRVENERERVIREANKKAEPSHWK